LAQRGPVVSPTAEKTTPISAFVLFLIYVSYLMLRRFSEGEHTPTIAAVFAIFGFLDVPIVYMSIRWWRTQHPQPVIGGGPNSGLAPAMRLPTYSNVVAFLAFAALVVWFRYSVAMAERRVEEDAALKALNEGSNATSERLKAQEVR
jgi:heme exporter protein C